MPIQVLCTGCQKKLAVKDELAGKKIRCKACGGILVVPAMAAKPAPARQAPPASSRPTGSARPAAAKPAAPRPAIAPRAVPPPPPPVADDGLIGLAELESLPVAPTSQPSRYVAPVAPSKPKFKPVVTSSSASSGGGLGKKVWSAIVGVCLVLGLIGKILRVYNTATGSSGSASSVNGRSMTTPLWTPQSVAATIPARPSMISADGYQHGTVTLTNHVGLSTTVKVYLPAGQHAPRSLAAVMIAPAGTMGIVGNDLGDGDSSEHVPYAQAGFAVIAYSLSGPLQGELSKVTNGELKAAAEKFHGARGGIVDGEDALAYALKQFPEIDPNRIGNAGHSSAAAHALMFAQNEPQIKACCSYAPAMDLAGSDLSQYFGEMKPFLPSIEQWATEYSAFRTGSPRCPVLLFHARDDENVPFAKSEAYASRFPTRVKFVTASSGGHYESMIRNGIPAGIAFLKSELK